MRFADGVLRPLLHLGLPIFVRKIATLFRCCQRASFCACLAAVFNGDEKSAGFAISVVRFWIAVRSIKATLTHLPAEGNWDSTHASSIVF